MLLFGFLDISHTIHPGGILTLHSFLVPRVRIQSFNYDPGLSDLYGAPAGRAMQRGTRNPGRYGWCLI